LSVFDHSRDFLQRHYVEVEKLRVAVWEELQKVERELVLWGELKEEDRTVLAQAEYEGEVLKVTVNDYLPKRSHVLHDGSLTRNWTDPVTEAIRRLEEKCGCRIRFEKALCVIVAFLPRLTWWDPDNRAIGKIVNGLRYAGVITGDTWDKLVYMVIGNVDRKRPRTEVYVVEQERALPVVLRAINYGRESVGERVENRELSTSPEFSRINPSTVDS